MCITVDLAAPGTRHKEIALGRASSVPPKYLLISCIKVSSAVWGTAQRGSGKLTTPLRLNMVITGVSAPADRVLRHVSTVLTATTANASFSLASTSKSQTYSFILRCDL